MNTELRIAIGSDHKGVDLKEAAVEILRGWGFEVEDLGPFTKEACNYAEYANAVCKRVADGRADRGVLVCFSGQGMSIAANRWKGVRAGILRTPQDAALSRHHNDSNVICIPSAFVSPDYVDDLLQTWLTAEYEGGRHVARLQTASGSPLAVTDPELAGYIEEERQRQLNNIELIASENFASPAVMEAQGSCLTNKYAEGYPNRRWYGGCEVVDKVEQLAIDRAKALFGCEAVNVQAHSGSQANMSVYQACINPGDTILTMDLACGGHLSHGFFANFSGKQYNVVHYGVNPETECIDYDDMAAKAREVKPALILAGASAYSRTIDFARIREICDEVGAIMFVDMAHIAGLVAGGAHPSPVPYADFVSTTTHKSLRGPRGGLVMCKAKWEKKLNSATFPGLQGGPLMHVIAAKAACLGEALKPAFRDYAAQVVKNAKAMADKLAQLGFRIVAGGTDNHCFLVDLSSKGINGAEAQIALDRVGITVNKNAIPYDKGTTNKPSGIRIGTPAVTTRGMKEADVRKVAEYIGRCLAILAAQKVCETPEAYDVLRKEVSEFNKAFPMP
ncbi:MAG: serine hydroxymethyltransferase [Akkermansia sp.]|nr:serine hydroxymethyltransferase [Akkermansia sp.]